MKKSINMWVVRAGEGAYLFNEFKDKNVIAIGWNGLGDLSKLKDFDKICDAYVKENPDDSNYEVGAAVGKIAKFRFNFKIGDIVITYNPNDRTYLVGEIISDYIFDKSLMEYHHIRKVNWLNKIGRDDLSKKTRNTLGATMTIFEIVGNQKNEILSFIRNKKATSIEKEQSRNINRLNNIIEESRRKLPEPKRLIMTIEGFYRLYKNGKLNFNGEYQRSEVWDPKRKHLLIDSILRRYDISSIFLRRAPGRETYEVLDGQQRLKTIFSFLEDGFETSEEMGSLKFSQLPAPIRGKNIECYPISYVEINTKDDFTTADIFLRLQEGLPLNSAEKLNAMLGFLREKILQLSQHNFMKRTKLSKHRFNYRYLLAQVYLLTFKEKEMDVKFRNLQEIYEMYKNRSPPNCVENSVRRVLNLLNKEFGEDAYIIQHNADFISIFLLAKQLYEEYATNEKLNLRDFFIDFITSVEDVGDSSRGKNAPYYEYMMMRKTSADSAKSINLRRKIILSKYLEFNKKIKKKDPKRCFDYSEKLKVYRRDKGICQICGKETIFRDGVVDHVKAHRKTGKTKIYNAQWSCIKCNLKKSGK